MLKHCKLALTLVLSIVGSQTLAAPVTQEAEPVLRFAILGDAEPKPKAEFPGLAGAVDDVNRLAQEQRVDFAIGVGDIAHKGTVIQYEQASRELTRLTMPFYPIMGNEEHGSTVERYLKYAQQWNEGKIKIEEPSYVLELDTMALVFASPDHGRDFNDEGVAWVLEQLQRLAPKPVMLVVHGAPAGVFPENAEKGIHNPGFSEVTEQPNLLAVISGDLHMDMDRVEHSKEIDQVHYLHIPALERTKIPDESRHTAMFRVISVSADDQVMVETYQVGSEQPLADHQYQFSFTRPLTR